MQLRGTDRRVCDLYKPDGDVHAVWVSSPVNLDPAWSLANGSTAIEILPRHLRGVDSEA